MTHKKLDINEALYPYFAFFNEENEYFLKFPDGQLMPTRYNTLNHLYKKAKIKPFYNKEGNPTGRVKLIIPKSVLQSLDPDNIDNKTFWEVISEKYKYVSVAGGPETIKTTKEVNEATFGMASNLGAIKDLTDCLSSQDKAKMLEIGYGYGNVGFHVMENHKNTEYFGIDIVDRIKIMKHFYECDGWEIPEVIPKELDVVYSINVFQHLSQAQRWNYLEKAKEYLKTDGKMIFASFIITEQNKDSECWGLADYHGRGYCHFFNQPTEVDFDYELKDKLSELNFEILKFRILPPNFLYCLVQKKC